MFKIGEFSTLAKTTVKTLRFYDEIDLFKPKFIDENGYRYYSVEDLSALQLIRELRACGVSVDEVRRAMDGEDIVNVLTRRRAEIERELETNRESLTSVRQMIASAKKGGIMKKYQARLETLPACTVYTRHGIIPTYSGLTEFILEAGKECSENNPGLECTEPGYCFVTYAAAEYREKDVELIYHEAVKKRGRDSENIRFTELSEQPAVCVEHRGPWNKLGEAYAFTVGYIKEKGFVIDGSIRECYIHGCWDTEDEADYLTILQVPIKKG